MKKLNLNDLKIESFITKVKTAEAVTIDGGISGNANQTFVPQESVCHFCNQYPSTNEMNPDCDNYWHLRPDSDAPVRNSILK